MVEPNINAYLQNQLKQAQDIQAQIEQIANQRYQLDIKVKEIDRTLKELSSVKDGTPIYKNVGPVLYKIDDKNKLVSDLEEQKELSQMRLKTLENQQKNLEEKYKELEETIQKRYEEASGKKQN
ncbi:prefoldin subunit beta [Acidiplasma cupricumulans]|uniref:Prefoldin subunit beta n=1 Tax=Acidiplasma cupricumulans TaxID=312540 RepID=A0A0Q0REJ4_9ARCH|nr:prefoldin subunit beta [Acidiplasma cupricumulans]KQB33490.1 prefoldin subunit beta [Acidiplasma cupricumulans]